MEKDSMSFPFNHHKLFKVLKWCANSGVIPTPEGFESVIEETGSLDEADIVSSVNSANELYHSVVLDIDRNAMLIPSSTPGHYHLYIPASIRYENYFELLRVLANCGIIEDGYAQASIMRGFSAVRLPWVRKGAI
jgi:hypothetical protein